MTSNGTASRVHREYTRQGEAQNEFVNLDIIFVDSARAKPMADHVCAFGAGATLDQ